MIRVDGQAKFDELLKADRSIAFIFFSWSGPAYVSERLVAEWETSWLRKSPFADIPLFRISPDETAVVQEWVSVEAENAEEGMEGGYGSVLWLEKGKRVKYIRDAGKRGREALAQITKEVWGQGEADGAVHP